jgi:predicted MFS family arabinose efflux permease
MGRPPAEPLANALPNQPVAAGANDSLYDSRPLAALAALAAVGAAAFCFITGENLVVGLLPQMSSSLHSSLSATGLLVTFYAVVVVLASAPLTHLTRRVPRRWLLAGMLATFVLGNLAVALAPTYGWVLAARIVLALSQALYWSIAAVTAAGLFSPQARGRAVAGVFAGSGLGSVLGVPLGTWLGQQAGWRVAFVALAVAGFVCMGAVALLLPTSKPSDSNAAAGSAPDARRYRVIVAATILAIAGFFTAFTYISPFLTKISGFARHDVAPVLLLTGVASTIGVAAVGLAYRRRPRAATIAPVAVLAASIFGLYMFATDGLVAIGFIALDSLALAGLAIAMQTGVLVVAPRGTDIASAWFSASFNVGIASGPVIGAITLSTLGLRSTPLVGAVLVSAAVAVLVLGSRSRRDPALQRD